MATNFQLQISLSKFQPFHVKCTLNDSHTEHAISYSNLAKSEKQKSNFGCRAARKTKKAKIKNNKTLLYITMTMTININIFINKIMSLRASFNKVCFLCLSCYISNGFWLGHKVGFSGAVFFYLVVPGSTGDEGYPRLPIIIVLRSTLIIWLPRELWFEVDLDLILLLTCTGFYLCLAIICDVPNIYPWHHWIQGEVTLVLCIPVTLALVKMTNLGLNFTAFGRLRCPLFCQGWLDFHKKWHIS